MSGETWSQECGAKYRMFMTRHPAPYSACARLTAIKTRRAYLTALKNIPFDDLLVSLAENAPYFAKLRAAEKFPMQLGSMALCISIASSLPPLRPDRHCTVRAGDMPGG